MLKIITACIVCALWSSNDGDDSLDTSYDIGDLAPSTREAFRTIVQTFVDTHAPDCQEWITRYGEESLGHDLWLTAQGHGAGFWDRGAGELGERLSEAARLSGFAGADLYAGDDGLIYLSGWKTARC